MGYKKMSLFSLAFLLYFFKLLAGNDIAKQNVTFSFVLVLSVDFAAFQMFLLGNL